MQSGARFRISTLEMEWGEVGALPWLSGRPYSYRITGGEDDLATEDPEAVVGVETENKMQVWSA